MKKQKIAVLVLTISLIFSGVSIASYNENNTKVSKLNKNILERKLENRDKEDEINKIMSEAEKYVPGIKEKWENLINERKEIKKEISNLVKNKIINKKGCSESEKNKHKEEMESLREKVKNGEITKKEAKKIIKSKINKDKCGHKKEMYKQKKEERRVLFQEFSNAVKSKDKDKIEESFNKIMENEKEINNKLNEILKKLKIENN